MNVILKSGFKSFSKILSIIKRENLVNIIITLWLRCGAFLIIFGQLPAT